MMRRRFGLMPMQKVKATSPKFSVDTSVAQANLEKIQAFIDQLTPSIARMSSSAQAEFNTLAGRLQNVSMRIENQYALYHKLEVAAVQAASSTGKNSTQYLNLEKRMLSTDSAINSLISKQSKLKAELSDVTSATGKVGTGMTDAGNKSERAAKKSTSAWSNTMRMFEKMMIRIAAFKVFSALSQGITIGIQDMAQASSAANAAMSSLATSSLYLKNSFATALMPAIQAMIPTITWLSNQLASLFNTIGMLGARIFGGSTTFAVAQRAQVNYAQTVGGIGDKAKDTTAKVKELQRTVMGFDELNVLSKPTSDTSTPSAGTSSNKNAGMPSVGSMFQNVKIPAGIEALGDKVKAFFAEWAKYAEPTTAAFQRLVKALEPLKTFAAKGVEDFYNDFLKPVGKWTLGTGLPRFLDITTALVKSIDWSGLNKALDNLWKALTPFAVHIGEGLLWFYQYVIAPITKWAANDLAPAALNLLANAIKLVDSVIQALKPLGIWLYNSFLKPLGEWTGKAVVTAINGISDAFNKISNWIKNNQVAVQNITKSVLAFFAAWKGAELIEFIVNAGGVIGILKRLGTAIWAVTGAKIVDKAQTIALAALYAKDFVVSIAKGTAALAKQIVQWVALKAAKIVDAIQTAAQTAATKLATVAQTALNFVLNANPIALVVIAITGLVAAIVVLWNKNAAFRDFILGVWKDLQDAAGKVGHWFQNDFVGFFKNAWKWIQDTWNGAGKWFGDIWQSIISKFKPNLISDAFGKAWSKIQDAWKGGPGWFKGIGRDIANNVVGNILGAINGVISGVNWVLNAVGARTRIQPLKVPHYVSGIGGHPGGPALVNDATGSLYREAVQLPSGKTFIPQGRNVLIPDLPRGSKVLPANETHALFPAYAGGIGDFFGNAVSAIKGLNLTSIWQYISDPRKLFQLAVDKFSNVLHINEPWLSLGNSAVQFVTNHAADALKGIFTMFEAPSGSGSGVDRWRGIASQALAMTGHFSPHNLQLLLAQMNTESGGNPSAINGWDINARLGHPSQGLMQVIPSTFSSYALPGHNSNILDPLSNIIAAIRYTWSAYGGPDDVWGQGHGYKNGIGKFDFGGWCADGGLFTAPALAGMGDAGPEAALPLNDNVYSQIAQGIQKNSSSSDSGKLDTDRIIGRMDKMEKAIENMKLYLYSDDRKIAESANNGNRIIGRTRPMAT
jgi:hypothetical protein